MEVAGPLLLVVLAIVPGMALLGRSVSASGDHDEPWSGWLAAVVLSVAIVTVVASVGLVLGELGWALVGAAVVAVGVAALRLRGRDPRGLIHPPRDAWSLGSKAVVAAIPLSLLATPAWNFQLAAGMDAGAYEAYSNWYAITESYFFDMSPALALEGVEQDWVRAPYNAWAGDPLRQHYFPGYPVLLGVVKHLTGHIGTGWLLNIALSAVTVLILWQIARAVGASRTAAGVIVAVSTLSLMTLYYSKQLMAEQVGLLGVVALVWVVVDRRVPRVPAVWVSVAGVLLALLAKTDGYQVVLLVLAGTALAGRYDRRARAVAVAMLASAWGSSLLLIWLVLPGYLELLRFPRVGLIRLHLYGTGFVLLSMTLVTLWSAACWLLPRIGKAGSGRITRHRIQQGTVVLAVVWIAVGVWMLILRPAGLELDDAVDAFNLRRLAVVWSPVALLAIFSGAAFVSRRLPDTTRILAGFLTLVLASLLLESRHSPPDLWWMRRYVMIAAPIGVVALSAAWLAVRERGSRLPQLTAAATLSVVAVGLTWQVDMLATLYRHEQNPGMVDSLTRVLEVVDDDQALLVAAGGRGYVGMGNSLATLRPGPTVPAVPMDRIIEVAKRSDGTVVMVVPPGVVPFGCAPDHPVVDEFELLAAGANDAGWVNHREDLGPDADHRFHLAWQAVEVTDLSGPVTIDLTDHVEPGDTNGVFYWLGTTGGRCAWTNPVELGLIEASVSSQFGEVTGPAQATDLLPGHTMSELVHTDSEPGAYYQVDLGGGRELELTRIAIKQREDTRHHLLRDFRLEGSHDGVSWVTILEDTHPGGQGEWGTFGVGPSQGPFRHLRLVQSGPDSQGDHFLVFAQIELYGRLRVAPGPG